MSACPDEPQIERLWTEARADFAADAPNRAFIAHCRAARDLTEAARRYRQALNEPGRQAAAVERRLAEITALALVDLDANKSQAPSGRFRPLLVAVAALILIVALYGLWRALWLQ